MGERRPRRIDGDHLKRSVWRAGGDARSQDDRADPRKAPHSRLLSDPDRSVMASYAAFGEKKMYGKTVQGVIRSTFVVGEDGTLEQAQYAVKATGHVAKLRRDLGLA